MKTALCIYCKIRSDCMPGFTDEVLNGVGVLEDRVPISPEECAYYIAGDEGSRQKALREREEFNAYAQSLVKSFKRGS